MLKASILVVLALSLTSFAPTVQGFCDARGGGWNLVRHVPAGNAWHPATDDLLGTAVYGTFSTDITAPAFALPFSTNDFDQFLFTTGDNQLWLVADKSAVYGEYANDLRPIVASSLQASPYSVQWYNRAAYPEDPWISPENHRTSVDDGTLLYGEASYSLPSSVVSLARGGANVYIRRVRHPVDFCDARGGGWNLVRHVPAGNAWHPARDHLLGTAVYGTFSTNITAPAFALPFSTNDFDQFLFTTGDNQLWLVADKSAVYGTYVNEFRPIVASSLQASPYSARWYNRVGPPEDPWISPENHVISVTDGTLLYGEAGFSSRTHTVSLARGGANVYIRKLPV